MKRLTLALISSAMILAPAISAAPKNNKHLDPFVNGPANESRLIQEVRHRLISLPRYTVFDDLGFNVEGSTVILTGQVTLPILKDDAANAVKKIEGVDQVINNIEILPLSPNDNQIRRAVFRAIYGDPDLGMRYGYQAVPSIHIIVKNGNIRLEGVVSNQMDKEIAGIRANGVPGEFKVVNDLQVEGK